MRSASYEWDHERVGRSAYMMAGPAGTGNKPPPGIKKIVSPISGATLVTTDPGAILKDPLTGTKLRIVGGKAVPHTGDVEYNTLRYSKKFAISSDIDLLIHSLRRTNYINRNTNEKVCCAGTR